jgi:hypothetical protein
MERAYYIVKPGVIRDQLLFREASIERQRREIFKALKQVALATGCNPATCLIERNVCIGLVFDRGLPPAYLCKWKKVGQDTYWPRAGTKAGKTIADVFKFAEPRELDDALPSMESCSRVGDHFVVTGTYDEMRADEPLIPEGLEEHLERIRPSQFQKMLDAHNASSSQGGNGDG